MDREPEHWVGYDAACLNCGERFNPAGPDDLEHLRRRDGAECRGRAVLLGAVSTTEVGYGEIFG
jgi:hypothetical protein